MTCNISWRSYALLYVLLVVVVVGAWATIATMQDPPATFTNSLGMQMVLIPAGEFLMGAEEGRADTLNRFPYCDPKWFDGELPQHQVRITKPFYMGAHEVTLKQFLQFCHESNYKTDAERDGQPSWGYRWRSPSDWGLEQSKRFHPWSPGWEQTQEHAVNYVSWNDAVAFCEWLSKTEGKTYRLPTEAEWEYACRAGSSNRYHFGDDPDELIRYSNSADQDCERTISGALIASFDEKGNMTDTKLPFPYASGRDGYAWSAPVGRFNPNDFGLYDMHGNVFEWCSDRYNENYYENSPTDDPQGASTGSARVARGGGFNDTAVNLRCANRSTGTPSYRYCTYGFRVVCEP